MEDIYLKIKKRAGVLALSLTPMPFYEDMALELHNSTDFFKKDEIIKSLKIFVGSEVDNDLGHGLGHVSKVAVEAGALFIHEAKNHFEQNEITGGLRLVQSAGLLHDIRRKEPEHAKKGALCAADILRDYPFSENEIQDICTAIYNHEAFKPQRQTNALRGELLSFCIYDADKFRWGPDNFTDTVWQMLSYFNVPFKIFQKQYMKGLDGIKKIRGTFRSESGKKYGPEFIDAGLFIGDRLYEEFLK